jgi:hypothetical protein
MPRRGGAYTPTLAKGREAKGFTLARDRPLTGGRSESWHGESRPGKRRGWHPQGKCRYSSRGGGSTPLPKRQDACVRTLAVLAVLEQGGTGAGREQVFRAPSPFGRLAEEVD